MIPGTTVSRPSLNNKLTKRRSNNNNIYCSPRLRRDGEGPLDPIKWVRREQKIRTVCTSLAENLIANRGIMHPWRKREAVDPRPSPGPNAMIPGTTASRPSLNNNSHTKRRSNNNNNNNMDASRERTQR